MAWSDDVELIHVAGEAIRLSTYGDGRVDPVQLLAEFDDAGYMLVRKD